MEVSDQFEVAAALSPTTNSGTHWYPFHRISYWMVQLHKKALMSRSPHQTRHHTII